MEKKSLNKKVSLADMDELAKEICQMNFKSDFKAILRLKQILESFDLSEFARLIRILTIKGETTTRDTVLDYATFL